MKSEVAYAIRDYTDLKLAMSQANRLPMLTEATEPDRAALVTIVAELGTNILKYARNGYISLRRLEQPEGVDIEVVAEDEGPGIESVALALQEHYSTGSSLGLGLPAVKRMSDDLRIESVHGKGLKVVALKRISGKPWRAHSANASAALVPSPQAVADKRLDVGECVRPMRNQSACGDATIYILVPGGALLAIADATGHGTSAGQVAHRVRAVLSVMPDPSRLSACLEALHHALKLSVGAAVGLLHLDFATRLVRYLGVGNTGILRVQGEHWRPISREGVLGQRLPTPYEQTAVLEPNDVIVMWTDGVSEHGLQAQVRHIVDKSASDIARELVMRAGKPYDDAGVLVLKWRGA